MCRQGKVFIVLQTSSHLPYSNNSGLVVAMSNIKKGSKSQDNNEPPRLLEEKLPYVIKGETAS